MVLDEAHAVKNASAARTVRLNRRAAAHSRPFPAHLAQQSFPMRLPLQSDCMPCGYGCLVGKFRPMMTARCTW